MAARGGRRPAQPKAAQDAEKVAEPTTEAADQAEPVVAEDQPAPGGKQEPVQGDAEREQGDQPDQRDEPPTDAEQPADAAPADAPSAEPEVTTERDPTDSGDTDEVDQVKAELAALASHEPVPGKALVETAELGVPSPTGTLLPNQVENTVGVAPSQALSEASVSPEGTAAKRAGLDDWPEGVEFVTRHSSLIVHGAATPVYFTDGRATVDDTDQLDAVAAVADEFDIKVAVPVRFILQAMAEDEQDDDGDDDTSSQS